MKNTLKLTFLILVTIIGTLIGVRLINTFKHPKSTMKLNMAHDVNFYVENNTQTIGIDAPTENSNLPEFRQLTVSGSGNNIRIKNIPNNGYLTDNYLIGKDQTDHGGYSTTSFIIYNPILNKKLYESHGEFNKGRSGGAYVDMNGGIVMSFLYGQYDYCLSCGYLLEEYLLVNPITNTVLINNTNHKDAFKSILKQINTSNGCSIVEGGEQLSFTEIQEKYGENKECKSSDQNISLFSGAGITPRQYFTIKQAVTDIINGKERSLVDLL